MTFSEALTGIKQGQNWERKGWNGKGMFVGLATNKMDEKRYGTWTVLDFELPFLYMRTVSDEHLVPWTASQTDLLADDWVLVPVDR